MRTNVWHWLLAEFPKVLPGLVIALAQYLWSRYREAGYEQRKRALRLKAAELGTLRESLSKAIDSPNEQVLEDLNQELEAVLAELTDLTVKARHRRLAERPLIARLFLLYTPSGAVAWLVQSLFYVMSFLFVVGLAAVVNFAIDPNETVSNAGLIRLILMLMAAVLLRWIALRLDYAAAARNTRADSSPGTRKSGHWIAILLYGAVLMITPFVWIGAALDDDDNLSSGALRDNLWWAIPFTLFLLFFAMSAVGWARAQMPRPPQPLSKLRSSLLWFFPAHPAGWLAVFASYLGVLTILVLVYAATKAKGEDRWFNLGAIPVVFLYLLCAWKWTQSFRPPLGSAGVEPGRDSQPRPEP